MLRSVKFLGQHCHSFRYHEDAAGSSAARETEWRMDEYGE
ncbi:hypothetical protein ACP4OV_006362 [Aristida adscensionis]